MTCGIIIAPTARYLATWMYTITHWTTGMANPKDLDDYLMKSGAMEYEAMSGMFEAFRVNLPQTTGLIQWMLNSAWPAVYWQLYDYYLLPTPAYYAAKKANAPVQLIYDYGDNSVYAVNEKRQDLKDLKASVFYMASMVKRYSSRDVQFDIAQISAKQLLPLSNFTGDVFLKLALKDSQGKTIGK